MCHVYLRNLLTHTVNNLLPKLNYVKQFQYFVVKQKFNIIHIICENFRTISWVLCKIQLIQFQRVKIESHKIWNLGSRLCFREVILIFLLCRTMLVDVIRNKKCMKFTMGQTSDSMMTMAYHFHRWVSAWCFFSWAHFGLTGSLAFHCQ